MATEQKQQRKREESGIWKSYFRLMFKAKLPWLWIVFVTIMYLLSATVSLIFPDYAGKIMTGVLEPKIIYGAVGLIIASVFISGFVAFLNKILTAKIDVSYRSLIWERLMKSPIAFYDKLKSTSMISRITTDAATISTVLGSLVPSLSATIYGTVGIVAVIFSYEWRLGIAVLAYIPFYLLFNFYYGKWSYRTNKETYNRLSTLTQFLSELLMSVPLIKTFANETKEDIRGQKNLNFYYRANLKRYIVMWAENPISGTLTLGMDIFVIAYGGYLVKTEVISLQEWVSFFLYIGMLWGLLTSYLILYVEVKKSQGATDRIAILMEGELEQYEKNLSIERMDHDIVFKNVSFAYGEKDVFTDLNFTIPKGTQTAIVGPSGGGKSTIFSLLQQFYQPKTGEILMGNTNISNYHLQQWRDLFAVVAQDSPMISGTIRDNILYGLNRTVSEVELIEAAKKANALEFIEDFTGGFDATVGEGGTSLSGGQRQRLAIARAILRNSEILLLDEATASLDSQSEKLIQDALKTLMHGRTTVIISHDLSNVRHADQVIVLNGETIDGIGSHKELMETNELYRMFVQYHTSS